MDTEKKIEFWSRGTLLRTNLDMSVIETYNHVAGAWLLIRNDLRREGLAIEAKQAIERETGPLTIAEIAAAKEELYQIGKRKEEIERRVRLSLHSYDWRELADAGMRLDAIIRHREMNAKGLGSAIHAVDSYLSKKK